MKNQGSLDKEKPDAPCESCDVGPPGRHGKKEKKNPAVWGNAAAPLQLGVPPMTLSQGPHVSDGHQLQRSRVGNGMRRGDGRMGSCTCLVDPGSWIHTDTHQTTTPSCSFHWFSPPPRSRTVSGDHFPSDPMCPTLPVSRTMRAALRRRALQRTGACASTRPPCPSVRCISTRIWGFFALFWGFQCCV